MRDWRVKGEAYLRMANRPPARAAWLLPGVWAAVILVFSLTPALPGSDLIPDKVVHFAAYAVLALLLRRALRASAVGAPAVAAVLAAVAYGALIEAIQSLLPWRRAEWWDLGADALGAVLAVIAGSRWTL